MKKKLRDLVLVLIMGLAGVILVTYSAISDTEPEFNVFKIIALVGVAWIVVAICICVKWRNITWSDLK